MDTKVIREKEELTGRRRYKETMISRYGPCVLKLEVEVATYRLLHEFDPKLRSTKEVFRWTCSWRDARPEDVSPDQLAP